MTNKFWIVMSAISGPSKYPYRHNSEAEAFLEAERLARNVGGVFFVLEALGASGRVDVQTHRFSEAVRDEIPF